MTPDKRERANAIEQRYRSGETLKQIGDSYGITRERVRQILLDCGVDSNVGGITVRRQKRLSAAEQHREDRAIKVWGMSLAKKKEHLSEHGRGPFIAFTEQRNNALHRGIQWRMSFGEWWEFWQRSEHWNERGRGYGYVMARFGDVGPYMISNVYICTQVQNLDDWRQRRNRNNNSLSTQRI